MLRRIWNFLQTILQELSPARRSFSEQDVSIVQPVSTMKKDFPVTNKVSVVLLSIQERTTEPHRAFVRPKHPASRYRDLDIMLAEIKRDRLNNTETTLIARPVHRLARQLQRSIEQEEGE